MDQLENCTVIEGSLHIVLIDHAVPSEYESKQYPKLREVTEYLLLYRVYGLKTLRHLFPNLNVIRGQKLKYNYALVLFEVPDLEELGLIGLTAVARGAIRLEKNQKLCYERTIDWSQIINLENTKMEDNFIAKNRNEGLECPDYCPASCPQNSEGNSLCWSSGADHCQKGKSSKKYSCNNSYESTVLHHMFIIVTLYVYVAQLPIAMLITTLLLCKLQV